MKNIERLEVQGVIISVMLNQISLFDGMDQFKNLGFKTEIMIRGDFYPYIFKDLTKWFNSEYIEPHKWEPWELEAMKHIDKKYTSIEYVEGYVCVTEFGRDEKNLFLINFPSIKEGDLIYIDEELERNGMHR